jgi:diguanylate cyclase (GGDEF)-like protein
LGAREHTGVVLRRPSPARRPLGADPYRRLPSIAFQLMREDTPDDVRRRVTAVLALLVPHQAAHLAAVEPERLRAALVGGSCTGRLEDVRPEIGSEQQLELPLVAHGVLVGNLTVSRAEGERFDEREVGVLRAFAELAALALYNAHVRAELVRLAHTDPLTGLANRRGLARALAAATAPRSLLLLDLDGLKAVNDEVGYEAGDLIIRAAAEALAAEVDEHELAARLGGDEFVALLDSGEAGALERGARVTRALDELALPPAIRARFRGGSVGAVAALPGEDADALLRRAASHMRERKRTRRGRV